MKETIKKCIIKDDANEIVKKMLDADVIAFATPIYFYEMCGQMKTLLDRTNQIFTEKYTFRDIYLLAASADTDTSSMDGVIKGLQGWIDCFEKTNLSGVVRGVGVTHVGDIYNQSRVLQEAYEMGKNI